MSTQSAGALERFAALLALEHLLRGMHGSVLRKADFMAERFIAQLAGKWSLPIVGSPCMHLESVRRAEHLVALDAAVDVAERMMMEPVSGVGRVQARVTWMNATQQRVQVRW